MGATFPPPSDRVVDRGRSVAAAPAAHPAKGSGKADRATAPAAPYGEVGVLAYDGERVQCHLCGRFFADLGGHSRQAHGVPAVAYKARFGLKARVGLLGPDLRDRRRAQAKSRVGSPGFARFLAAGRRARPGPSPGEARFSATAATPPDKGNSDVRTPVPTGAPVPAGHRSVTIRASSDALPWRAIRRRRLTDGNGRRPMDVLPGVSVVVLGLPYGDRLVPSLAAILAQDYPGDIEILLLAGDATDGALAETAALAPGFAVEARHPGGPAQAWARGDVVAFIAPDAAIAPGWLSSLVRPLATPSNASTTEAVPRVVLADGDAPPALVDAETAARLLGATDPTYRGLAIPVGLCRLLSGFETGFAGTLEDAGGSWDDALPRLGILLGGLSRPRQAVPPTHIAPGRMAVVVLVALLLAEVVTALVDVRWGIAGHGVLLVLLAAVAAQAAYRAGPAVPGAAPSADRRLANFAAALALAPLIRITSLALPLAEFPRPAWYAVVAVPILAATWAAARANGYRRRDVNLWLDVRPRALATTLAVALSGIAIGYAEYRILSPAPLIDGFAPVPLIGAVASLVFGTGLTEEVVFRGVLQRAAGDLLGVGAGIAYASAVFAVLHVGHRSLLDVVFVFVVAIGFALVVLRTRSLAGVIAAHGLTNVCLFVVFPLLLGSG